MKTQQEVEDALGAMVEGMPGDELVEIGIGLTARGLFRLKEQQGVAEAASTAGAIVSTMSGIHLDFQRLVARTPPGTSAQNGRRK